MQLNTLLNARPLHNGMISGPSYARLLSACQGQMQDAAGETALDPVRDFAKLWITYLRKSFGRVSTSYADLSWYVFVATETYSI